MAAETGPVSLPRELLDFYNGLWEIQQKYVDECRKMEVFAVPNEWVWNGTSPLAASIKPVVDPDLARELFNQLLELLACHKPDWLAETKKLEGMTKKEFSDLIVFSLAGDRKSVAEIINRLEIRPEVAEFLVFQTIKPFFQVFAEAAKPYLDAENWLQNCCPVCGHKAGMARIKEEEEGKRYLQCSYCETEWLFKRLACPNCGNEDHQTLSFLLIEETPGYQIDVCEVCKSYLKVIDERTGLKPSLARSEIQTIYLDVIAQQKGYSNLAANA